MSEPFVFTDDMLRANLVATASTAGVSLFLCAFILICALIIHLHPTGKRHLDRISFRLLLWSVAWEIVYDASYIFLYASLEFSQYVKETRMCPAGVYIMISSMGVVNWLCTCIAINLMLTISFGINPIKQRLERWYILGSMFLGLLVPVIPTALGHFGPDPDYGICYFASDNDETRILQFLLDLILSCLISAIAVGVTLYTIFHHGRATSRALIAGHHLNVSIQGSEELSGPSNTTSLEVHSGSVWWHRIRQNPFSRKNRVERCERRRRQSTMGHLQDKFLGIALKISLYPLSMVIINGVVTAGDLYFSSSTVGSEAEYALYIIYGAFYSGRGIFFCLLGLFVDPCLRKGVRSMWRSWRNGSTSSSTNIEQAADKRDQSFAEFLSFTGGGRDIGFSGDELDATSRRPSTATIDVTDALRKLPYDNPLSPSSNSPAILPPIPEISGTRKLRYGNGNEKSPDERYTASVKEVGTQSRSFAGVQTESLPAGLTDEVDVDLRLGTGHNDPDISALKDEDEIKTHIALTRDVGDDSQDGALRISIQDGPIPILILGSANSTAVRTDNGERVNAGEAERGEAGMGRARRRMAEREAKKMFEEVEARL